MEIYEGPFKWFIPDDQVWKVHNIMIGGRSAGKRYWIRKQLIKEILNMHYGENSKEREKVLENIRKYDEREERNIMNRIKCDSKYSGVQALDDYLIDYLEKDMSDTSERIVKEIERNHSNRRIKNIVEKFVKRGEPE